MNPQSASVVHEEALFSAATREYERGRLLWILGCCTPLLLLPVVSFLVGGGVRSHFVLGAALYALAVVVLWRGREAARGVLAGIQSGLIPLVLAHAANLYGHVCTPAGCSTLCVPACVLGGVLAGLWVAYSARKAGWGAQPLVSAGIIAGVAGSLGCACVGMSGIVGLSLGLGGTLVAAKLLPARAR